ncbi:type II toxin-antitoxin system RelE/ParE family toxin [Desulfovibrio sp. OttesenSCG-928-M14]|nr:type II toxin-antitoxin system RelE/ParE family toxin [Desulfovibrio sp. OttesenSCG-928-M16]MDL2217000.1 type II toxin-antitoxin system RelE/ParE family toxin [Desulfovibrio sp. OttesenSCG-928-M14]
MEIIYTPGAIRLLKKLPQADRETIKKLVKLLSFWPNDDRHIIHLSGRDDFRLKQGRHRVIFDVDEERAEVHITYVGLRDEKTYRK